ncbi:hypothetical protein [Leptolyngbya sp. 7M]|uniref:hypothetical protein n=1 Tax=Leptolyngbya sp. 7M TaxID=2812896 RepID=UPI001B8D85F5|nr:hypothetical protein [Leptolyngbya sp. 7M]QYO64861.1 hypothetical protein JVX88_35770 [Leptolyngbya sp. 7M]
MKHKLNKTFVITFSTTFASVVDTVGATLALLSNSLLAQEAVAPEDLYVGL